MSAIHLEYALFTLYILLGPFLWFWIGFAMIKGRQRMMLIELPAPVLPSSPRVTILIPAKDEGERIAACIESAIAQDYPNFDVIAVNDRSIDATGRVMDEVAGRHERLRVLHIEEGALPAGWTGKCNALFNAVKGATGEWLLFVDSDVVLQPHALSATLEFCVSKEVDLFSLLPRLECHSFWESLLVPLAGGALTTTYLVALTNNDHLPGISFANGQFLMIRRDVYDGIGGHACVKDKFCEDVALARLLKSTGKRVRISWGADLAAVRMYSSLASIFKGWGRNFYAGSLGRPWRILLVGLVIVACSFSAYVALAWAVWRIFHPVNAYGAYGWALSAIVHLILMMGALGAMYSWSGNRRSSALLFPLGGSILLLIFAKALQMCATGKVEWRGTQYGHRSG